MLLTPININGGCHENNVMPLTNAKYVITPIIENVIRRTATPTVIVERELVSFTRLFMLIESMKMDAQLALDASKYKFGKYVCLMLFSSSSLSSVSLVSPSLPAFRIFCYTLLARYAVHLTDEIERQENLCATQHKWRKMPDCFAVLECRVCMAGRRV